MDLFDAMDRDEAKRQADAASGSTTAAAQLGTRSNPVLVDDSLQTMEPLIQNQPAALGTASGIPLSVEETKDEELGIDSQREMMADFKSATANLTPDQPLNPRQDDIAAAVPDQNSTPGRSLKDYLPNFGFGSGSSSSASSVQSQYKDLPREARESESGQWDLQPNSSDKRMEQDNSTEQRDLYSQYQDLPRAVIDSESGKWESEALRESQPRPSHSTAPVQDLRSDSVSDELPSVERPRYSVNVGTKPAPVTGSAISLESVNDEAGTTRLEPSTLWPFSHTVKKREPVQPEPKDESANQPSALLQGFNAAQSKLDSAVEKVRNSIDSFAEKNLRYDASTQDQRKLPTSEIPTLVNTANEENADIIRTRMHPADERQRESQPHPDGKRNIYS